MIFLSFLILALTAFHASAQGFLYRITVNGTLITTPYTGNVPGGPKNPSVIRQISSPDPMHGANNPALACGRDATAGTLNAPASPGDTVTFDWRGEDLRPWPHNIGPMLTYMAYCGAPTCDKFDVTGALWFKIQEVGKKNATTWYQNDLMAGGVASATIPSTLSEGNYLLRHEIIALHLATTKGGAEFYASCSQLTISSPPSTGLEFPGETAFIPGMYSDDDPGIFDPEVFNSDAPYIFPGIPVVTFAAATNPHGGVIGGVQPVRSPTSSGTASTQTASVPSGSGATQTAAPSGSSTSYLSRSGSSSGQTRKLQRRATPNQSDFLVVLPKPKHMSRIMRKLNLVHSIS